MGRWLLRRLEPGHRDRLDITRALGFDPEIPIQLFDLEVDPGATQNLSASRPELAQLLANALPHSSPPPADDNSRVSQEHLNALRALGYLD